MAKGKQCKFKLYTKKINFGKYKYEVFGGTCGGRSHSSMHKTRKEATKYKKDLETYAKKNPWLIQFRRLR